MYSSWYLLSQLHLNQYRFHLNTASLYYHCCPHWALKGDAITEVAEAWRWYDKGQLAIWLDNRPLPLKLKNAIAAFEAGYNLGYEEKQKNRRGE